MTIGSVTPEASTIIVGILKVLFEQVPKIADWIRKGSEDDDSPLAEQVRTILPEESESERARRQLEAQAEENQE